MHVANAAATVPQIEPDPGTPFRLADRFVERFHDGIGQSLFEFSVGLEQYRESVGPDAWRGVAATLGQHPALRGLLGQSPFARRAFTKTRGYAGDAETLDYVYAWTPSPPETSALGRRLLAWEQRSQTARAVRGRLDAVTSWLDQRLDEQHTLRVLSVASGHLREVQQSAVGYRADARVVAFDNDASSLARVASEQPDVTTQLGSVRDVVTGKVSWEGFDAIYSSGLYDYLSDRYATSLTRRLFDGLRPGGRLLVANLTPANDLAYLEACLDWWMTYRDEQSVLGLAAAIPPAQIASIRTWRTYERGVVFLELTRA